MAIASDTGRSKARVREDRDKSQRSDNRRPHRFTPDERPCIARDSGCAHKNLYVSPFHRYEFSLFGGVSCYQSKFGTRSWRRIVGRLRMVWQYRWITVQRLQSGISI